MLVAGTQSGSLVLNQTGRSGTCKISSSALCGIQNRLSSRSSMVKLRAIELPDGSIENNAARKQEGSEPIVGITSFRGGDGWIDLTFPSKTPRRLETAACLRAYSLC